MALDSVAVSKKEKMKSPQKKKPQNSPAKRNKSPGIRLASGRIYDSVNGKTCHQCRQKTRDFVAACTNQRKNKPCTIMLCHKCLLNRYGEKAEEVSASGEWTCPKCRGICNCSVCMKKKGQQPTGILITTAKATGFSSVSEMLLKGTVNSGKATADVTTPEKGVVSPRKPGKENSFDGKLDSNLPDPVGKKSSKSKEEGREKKKTKLEKIEGIDDKKRSVGETEESVTKSKKVKLVESREVDHGNNNDKMPKGSIVQANQKRPKKLKSVGLEERDNTEKNDSILARRTSPRKLRSPEKMSKPGMSESTVDKKMSVGETEQSVKKSRKMKLADSRETDNDKKSKPVDLEKDDVLARRTSPRKLKDADKVSKEPELNIGFPSEDNVNGRKDESTDIINNKNILKHHNTDFHADFPSPLGKELTRVAGIDVCAGDVGNALQFVEFFAVFGEVLEIKKGRPEIVLRDMLHGRAGRRGKLSATAQFHVDLLHILLKEQGKECSTLDLSFGRNYWFNALKKCLSGYQAILEEEGLDLDKTTDYETLGASLKLRLLNLLCDELLETEMLRKWIDEQNTKFAENIKEAKHKMNAAKDKEKSLKQQLKDDIAQAIIAKQGANLSISEHEAIVSRIKSETEKAHAEVLKSKGMLIKDSQSCNAVRTEPIFMGPGGHAYWKLNYSGKSDILRQDVGKGDSLTLDEKWFTIDVEGKEAIEKHISSVRGKRLRVPKVAVADIVQS